MKKLMLITCFILSGIVTTYADQYQSQMLKGIEMLQAASTPDAAMEAQGYFERLSALYPKDWLPLYYAAYSSLKSGFQQEKSDAKDAYYQKGIEFIHHAKQLNPDESEIYAMEGYLQLMYISNDAMRRAPSQTVAALELLERAKAMNPSNPRPWFVHGQNTLFTPAFFGGGENNAKPLLEKALALYNGFTPANELMPMWGKERCEKLLEKCNK